MLLVAVIFDCPVPYLRGLNGEGSVLSLPLGSTSVLNQFLRAMSGLDCSEALVVPGFPHGPEYERHLQSSGLMPLRVVTADELGPFLIHVHGDAKDESKQCHHRIPISI